MPQRADELCAAADGRSKASTAAHTVENKQRFIVLLTNDW